MSESTIAIEVIMSSSKTWPGVKLDPSQRSDSKPVSKAVVADVRTTRNNHVIKKKVLKKHATFYGPTARRQAEEVRERLINGGTRNAENLCCADGISPASLPYQSVVGEGFCLQ